MDNFIVIAVVTAIVGLAAWYIYRAKKSGQKCIGCPDARTCSGKGCNGGCGCGCSCGGDAAE